MKPPVWNWEQGVLLVFLLYAFSQSWCKQRGGPDSHFVWLTVMSNLAKAMTIWSVVEDAWLVVVEANLELVVDQLS